MCLNFKAKKRNFLKTSPWQKGGSTPKTAVVVGIAAPRREREDGRKERGEMGD